MDYTYFIKTFVALFVIVDGVGNVPIFSAVLDGFTVEQKRRTVKNSIFLAAAVLLGFIFFGTSLFSLLGIRFSSFKIASGILLAIISVEMLFGRKSRTELSPETLEEAVEEVSITPLAVPLLTGPGTITTAMVLFNDLVSGEEKLFFVAVVLAVFLVTYFILVKMDFFYRIMGKRGTRVATRLMGLIILSLAVEFITSGIKESGLV